jgi:hypothetical protein
MSKFYEKKKYFWEYDYDFGENFLRSIFNDNYIRKYSLSGDGIFNIVVLNNKIYSLSLKEASALLVNDGKKAFRDADKDTIVESIAKGFDELGIEYTINGGKFITFKIFGFIGKIEIVKKVVMPE